MGLGKPENGVKSLKIFLKKYMRRVHLGTPPSNPLGV